MIQTEKSNSTSRPFYFGQGPCQLMLGLSRCFPVYSLSPILLIQCCQVHFPKTNFTELTQNSYFSSPGNVYISGQVVVVEFKDTYTLVKPNLSRLNVHNFPVSPSHSGQLIFLQKMPVHHYKAKTCHSMLPRLFST